MKNKVMSIKSVTAQLKEQCPVNAAMARFDISSLSNQLKNEKAWHTKKRNSVVVFKSDDLHILLVVMHAVTRVPDHKIDVPLTIQVLEGHTRVVTKTETIALYKGDLLVLESGIPHDIEAVSESAFLLTLAVGRRTNDGTRQKENALPKTWGG